MAGKLTVSNITDYGLKWPRNCENATVNRKKITCVLPNHLCIHKELRAKLPVVIGLKWGIFLFHVVHWADTISSDAHKSSSSLKNSFACYTGKKEEHWVMNELSNTNSVGPLEKFNFLSQGSGVWMDHFTVVYLVAWPLNENEAGSDLVLIETSLFFLCKFPLSHTRTASLT